MNRRWKDFKDTVKKSIDIMSLPYMAILPGQMSFFILLSIIPVVALTMVLAIKFSINTSYIIDFVVNYFPKSVSPIILKIMNTDSIKVNQIVFLISAFFLASNTTHSIIVASSTIYNAGRRNYFRTRIKAILMIFILVALFTFALFGIGLGETIITNFRKVLPSDIFYYINISYTIIRIPISFLILFIAIKLIYTIAPNRNIKSSTVNSGAFFTTIMWLIATWLYSYYATNVLNWSLFYGTMANVIILMLWIYFLSYIFVFGMTINEHKLTQQEKSIN